MIVIPYTVETPYEALAECNADLWRIAVPTVPVVLASYESYGCWRRNTLGKVVAATNVISSLDGDMDSVVILDADVEPGPEADIAIYDLLGMDEDFACEVRPGQPRFQKVQAGVTAFNLLGSFGAAALNCWAQACDALLDGWEYVEDQDIRKCPDQVPLLDVLKMMKSYGASWRILPEWTNARHGNNPAGAFQHPPASRKYRETIDGDR